MEWTLGQFSLATGFVCLGSVLQAATGLGAGLVVVPLLAMISYHLVPGPMIFASLALSLTMTVAGRRHIEFDHMPALLSGLAAGTILASLYIAVVPLSRLGLVFGVLILVAVGLTLRAPRFRLTSAASLAGGVASGVMGTSAGIGAPVLALLYQHRSGPSIRATLAFLYVYSSLIMLLALHFAGRFGSPELVSGLYLVPGFVLGYLLSPRLAQWIDKGYARVAVLLISTVSAVLLIARSFLAS